MYLFFVRYFDRLWKLGLHQINPKNIFNMDETAMCWDEGNEKVICSKGQSRCHLMRTNSRSSATVAFTISADGDLLPPFVIFKVPYE